MGLLNVMKPEFSVFGVRGGSGGGWVDDDDDDDTGKGVVFERGGGSDFWGVHDWDAVRVGEWFTEKGSPADVIRFSYGYD
eukprot:3245186-Rhodomonas_salina.1